MLRFITSAISRAVGFSKSESRGTLLLIIIMLAYLTATKLVVKHLQSVESEIADPALEEWVQTVKASFDVSAEEQKIDKTVYLPTKRKSEKISYKKPLEKTYDKKIKAAEKAIEIKDLNIATADELQQVYGIGTAFSKRIVNYRNQLGGFASNEQLTEVYGLQDSTITKIDQYFQVLSHVRRININSDSAKVLASHPYISYDLAWVIINYRKQNGDIYSVEDLKKIKAIDEQTLSRLKPYLE